ncbi:MAG: ATP-dependent DNA ligase [Gemmatimonadaceae bacterium]
MAQFVGLFNALDATNATNAKRRILAEYMREAAPLDAVWAIYFLTGRRMRRAVSGRLLREWAAEWVELPGWLVEESYHAVGDLAETLAILCARGALQSPALHQPLGDFVQGEVAALGSEGPALQRTRIMRWWAQFDERTCFVVHKLITGGFRVGVSASLVSKALADVLACEPGAIQHRLMGNWLPSEEFAARLFSASDATAIRSRPYPFFLASPLEGGTEALGDASEWLAEWKWDGIRAQVIVRGGELFIWSRGEELLTDRFPELVVALGGLPDGTVIDGEIVPWEDERVLPFSVLQTRVTRKQLTARILRSAPVVLLAFDLLERGGRDVRTEPLWQRRVWLAELLGHRDGALRSSPEVTSGSWEAWATRRTEARERGVEGLMLKRRDSPYRAGRPRGDWWKWKIDPYTVDAVLVYAQAGHGRRAALYTDYTFAVWDGATLVPIAKAYSGLDDSEIATLDKWIRAHTTERFGPVRGVTPHHVFELGFEGIQRSTRHKSGVAVRFPRILRWRSDKGIRDAGTLGELEALIAATARRQPRRTPHEQVQALSLFGDEPARPDDA